MFESAKSAAIQLGLSDSNIAKCCKGKYKTTGGYHWKYVGDNLVKEMTDKENEQHTNSDSRQVETNKNAQSLVKSFAEKLKSQLSFGLEDKIPANVYSFVYITIDDLVKEMMGEDK